MVTTDVELQLTQQLKEAGKQLSLPPTSDDELLHVLDQTEKLLSMVDQSPNDLMKEVLNPLTKVLVDKSLLEHSNIDVKVAVASCLSEMTRITAPEAPYGDEELKDVFQLIVSTFEDLSDKSSKSYGKRISILETVCKVRSCVIMLDLECEELIVEMFDHFLKSIREHHPEIVFSSMVDIMYLIFEESEDISVNMLKPLLFSIKNDNERAVPVARKLGEKVLQKTRDILKPFLIKTISILGDSLDNYSPVLAAICEGTAVLEQNDEKALVQVEQQSDDSKLANERVEEEPKADESKITTVSSDDTNTTQVVKETNVEKPVETVPVTPNRTLKIVMSNGGRVTLKEKDPPLKKPEEAIDRQDSSLTLTTKPDVNDSVAELANVESNNKEGSKTDVLMDSVEHLKENDIQVSVPEAESKPEEASNKSDVIMTSAEPSASSHGDENKEDKNEDEIQVSVTETEAANGNLPEETNVEKVDLSNKEEEKAEVADGGPQSQNEGLTYKIHIRKGPRSKKKTFIKDDTPLIDVLKKKKTPIVQKEKLTETLEDGKKEDAVASGAKSEKTQGKKVGGGKKKRKLPGGGGSGAKKVKQGGKKAEEEGNKGNNNKPSTPPLIEEKEDDSDSSFDKPLRPSVKKDESDSDSKPIKKVNKTSSSSKVKSSVKKNASGKKVEEKDESKSLPEDDVNVNGMDVSPKPAVKTATEETTSKRKRSGVKDNANKNVKYDDSLIGMKVKVWWPDDKKYYEGVIESFYSAKNKHKVSYVDGDEEVLNLKKEKWEPLKEFSVKKKENKKPAEVESSDDDETLSEMITYKSKGKISAKTNDSTKSKSTDVEKELEDGDDAVTQEKSTETKKSNSKSRKKRKKM
ncbi:hypothetical protein LXL04_026012 [Taraxacum kok-saghyz]